ncbi:MAG: flagellar basal-body rod protein FlgF [bacterium]
MMRSMYAGVSGLKTHQTRMDVVGNNIANVNTVGFKGSRATFKEMLNQTLQGARAPQGNIGGVNPQQVGLGVDVGSIDTDFNQGNLQTTGLSTDLAIQGNGYFIVNDGEQDLYTRAGALTLDNNGNLVNGANGFTVQGWMADSDGNINNNQSVGDIVVPVGQDMAASASTKVGFGKNLDSRANVGDTRTATIDVYDSLGEQHTVSVEFEKIADNQWDWTITDATDAAVIYDTDGDGTNDSGSGTLTFDPVTGDIIGGMEGALDFAPTGGANDQTVDIDFNNVIQYAADYTIDGTSANGYEKGELESFSISDAGIITGSFSNGLTRSVGQLAVANFSNNAGLENKGDTLFSATSNSGIPQVGVANNAGRGSISSGTLEMSNVDLAEQFTDMISTQRGYQANSKIIATADQMLQELVNLKR